MPRLTLTTKTSLVMHISSTGALQAKPLTCAPGYGFNWLLMESLTNMRGKAARHTRQGSLACMAEIPNPNKKANCKQPKLTVG